MNEEQLKEAQVERIRVSKFKDLLDENGKPKIAPVQDFLPGIPWSIHLEAYDAYRKKYRTQEALIDLEKRHCLGGFYTGELDMFVPSWRDRVGDCRAEETD